MTPIRSLTLVTFLTVAVVAPGQAASGKKADKEHLAKAHLVSRSYAVADLVPTGDGACEADMLIKFVKQAIQPTSWKGHGGQGTVKFDAAGQCLVIHQTAAAHKQVDRLLKALVKLQSDAQKHEDRSVSGAAGALISQSVVPASFSACPTVSCAPARSTVKQYGHFVMDNVRVNAMGVTTTIKKIKIMYKGDGIEGDVAKCALTNGESERKGDTQKILDQLTQLVDSLKDKNEKKDEDKKVEEKPEAAAPPPCPISAYAVPATPCAVPPPPAPTKKECELSIQLEPIGMPHEVKDCDKEVKPCKCEKKAEKTETDDSAYNDD